MMPALLYHFYFMPKIVVIQMIGSISLRLLISSSLILQLRIYASLPVIKNIFKLTCYKEYIRAGIIKDIFEQGFTLEYLRA